jgi:rSAM/selenodomain-associated transferase 1
MSSRGAIPAADAVLIVFARAPVPGRVKTRLAPVLGGEGAARLHALLVERTLQTALAAGFARVELHGAPGTGGAFFRTMRERYGVRLRGQGRGNLGDRMHRALRRQPGALLVGSDCPALRPADLRTAAKALRAGQDAVFSPAADGGYALVGLRRSLPALFDGVQWGGAKVMAQTRARLRRLGWRWRELRTVWDIDRPADLARLRRARLFPTAAIPRRLSSAGRRRAAPSAGSRRRSGAPGRP